MSSYNSNPVSPPVQQSSSRVPPSAARAMFARQHQDIDIISIDELDLSDLSSDENIEVSPPPGLSGLTGLKKSTRKLPTRRDFEFVRQSMSSVSSMGIRSRESMLSRGSSVLSSEAEPDGEGGGGAPFEVW